MGKKKASPKTPKRVEVHSLMLIGYVVRYDKPIDEFGAKPLHLGDDKLLWIHPDGTLFLTEWSARRAINTSLRLQRRNNYRWNEMHGDYRVDPVYL